jgi:hypothetical protein
MMTSLKLLIRALGRTWLLACMPVDLSQLIQNPATYENKCVCVTGVTEGDGVNFVFFRPPRQQQKQQILVVNKNGPQSRFQPVDGHWYRLCGIVTADERGLFPCKFVLQDAHAIKRRSIPGGRSSVFSEMKARIQIRIDIIDEKGRAGNMILDVKGFDTIAINEIKQIKISAVSGDLSPGKLLSSYVIPDPKVATRYFDSATSTFYFSIKDGNIVFQ